MINEILKQGQKYAGGIVNYDSATGNQLPVGGTTLATPNIPISNVITPQSLAPTTPINLSGTVPPPVNNSAGVVAGAEQGVNQFNTEAEFQRQLDLQKKTEVDPSPMNDILRSLGVAEESLRGKGETQIQAEATAGLPDAQKRRSTLQGQISTGLAEYKALQTEFEKMSADIEAGAGRKGLTTGAVMGQQGAVDRARLAKLNSKASEIGLLQAQDSALKGDIETAQNAVDRAIDLKYQDREMEYTIKKAQYDRIKETLTAEEKKRGDALQAALEKEKTALAEKKEKEKDIQDLAFKVAPIDPSLVSSISSAKTFNEALRLAAPALNKLNREIIKVGDSTKLVDKLTGKVIQDYGTGKSATTDNYAISKTTLDTINDGDIVKTIAGVINKSGAKQSQSTNDAINVISGLQQLVKDAPSGVFKGVNPLLRTPNKFASSEALTNRSNIEAINLKVQQWASGAALTEEQTKQVAKITPRVGDTDKQIKAKTNALANYMVSQVSGQLAGQGIGFSMDNIDLFNRKPLDQDPLKVNTPQTVGGEDSLNLFN